MLFLLLWYVGVARRVYLWVWPHLHCFVLELEFSQRITFPEFELLPAQPFGHIVLRSFFVDRLELIEVRCVPTLAQLEQANQKYLSLLVQLVPKYLNESL